MNQLTRQEVEAVVERFDPRANKCDYCKYDGKVTPFCEYCGCEYPRGVTVGHVLDYAIRQPGGLSQYLQEKIMDTWFHFKLSTSLQEIIEESGWESQDEDSSIEVLKSPEANALCQFILSLFPIDDE